MAKQPARPAAGTAYTMARSIADPCTFEASRDSNHIISTTRSTTEMATTANQYSAFHKIRIGLQA